VSARLCVKWVVQSLYYLLLRFERNQNRKNAAELTFVTMFAIVPLMTAVYVALTWHPLSSPLADQFHSFVFKHFAPASGEALLVYLQGFAEQAKGLTWIGLGLLFVSAMSLMLTIEGAFNQIWRVKSQRVGRRLMLYWLAIFIGPVLLALGFLLSSYVMSSSLWMEYVESVLHIQAPLFKNLPWMISGVALMGMYYFLPSCKVRLFHAFVGGFSTALLLEAGKSLFVFFVSFAPSYKLVYGAFAIVPLFLIWVYVAWCLVLFGAEVVRALPFARRGGQSKRVSPLDWALIILRSLYNAEGNQLDRERLVSSLSLYDADEWESVLLAMVKAEWITNDNDTFQLIENLHFKTVGDLSELIHAYRLEKFAVSKRGTPWIEVLQPILMDLKEHKKAALGLPIASILNFPDANE